LAGAGKTDWDGEKQACVKDRRLTTQGSKEDFEQKLTKLAKAEFLFLVGRDSKRFAFFLGLVSARLRMNRPKFV
jgi:hypothetical protein